MKINGKKIREARKKRGLTQIELATGICSQATISQLENKDRCDNLPIVVRICNRIDIGIEEILIDVKSSSVSESLKKIDYLCTHLLYDIALELLNSSISIESIENQSELAEALYYFGLTNLITNKDRKKAQVFFLKILNIDSSNTLKILAKSSLGIFFAESEDFEIAEEYFQSSLKEARMLERPNDIEIARVFYNAAKFYSLIKKYELAIELCDEGVDLCKQNQTTYLLDFLIYEKAYNTLFLDKKSGKKYYDLARLIASFNDNSAIISTIDSDLGIKK